MTTPIETGIQFDKKIDSFISEHKIRSETHGGEATMVRLEVPQRFIINRWYARPGFFYEEGVSFKPSAHVDLIKKTDGGVLSRSINISMVPRDISIPRVFYNLTLTEGKEPELTFGQGDVGTKMKASEDVLNIFFDLVDWALLPLPEIEKYMLQLRELGHGHYSETEFKLLERTLDWVASHHRGETRKSGDPYLSHPVAAALTLMELGIFDLEIIQAELGHDVPEDSKELSQPYGMKLSHWEEKTTERLSETGLFGPRPIRIMIHLAKPKADGREIRTYEQGVSKYYERVASHPDIIITKMPEKLHNLETLEHMTPAEQDATITEMNEVYFYLFLGALDKYPTQTRILIERMITAIRRLKPNAEIPDVLSKIDEMVSRRE